MLRSSLMGVCHPHTHTPPPHITQSSELPATGYEGLQGMHPMVNPGVRNSNDRQITHQCVTGQPGIKQREIVYTHTHTHTL